MSDEPQVKFRHAPISNHWWWRLDTQDLTQALYYWQGPFPTRDLAEQASKRVLEHETRK